MSQAPSPSPGTLDPAQSVEGLLQLAHARAEAGDSEGAGRTFAAALHLAEAHGLWEPTARAQAWLAGVDVRNGRLELARQRLDRAWALCVDHAVSPLLQAEVGSQLGQVLVFQGQPGAGVAHMQRARLAFGELGHPTERDELDLAIAAIHTRAAQAVDDTPDDSEARVRALARLGEVRLGLGEPRSARDAFARAWETASTAELSESTQARLGLDFASLLVAAGPAHHPRAWQVLQALPVVPAPQRDRYDALVATLAEASPPDSAAH